MTYGNGVTQSFAGGDGCTGLDRYGRVTDLHFTHTAMAPPDHTIHRYQYGYDKAGNP